MPLWAPSCRLCVERNSFSRDRIPGSDARAFLSITPKSGPGRTLWALNMLRRIVKGEVKSADHVGIVRLSVRRVVEEPDGRRAGGGGRPPTPTTGMRHAAGGPSPKHWPPRCGPSSTISPSKPLPTHVVSVLAKLHQFRGESLFTTWAYKFVMFEVSTKLARHFWRRADLPSEPVDWGRLADRFGLQAGRAVRGS